MAKGDDLQQRLVDLAVAIAGISSGFPQTATGRCIADQLVRSASSPALNYGEARGAESRRDFVHKLGIVQKELNETSIALEIAERTGLCAADQLLPLRRECSELQKIIGASISTAAGREEKRNG